GETPGERRFILTVPGRGFKFVAPVSVIPNPPALSELPIRREPVPAPAELSTANHRRRWILGIGSGVVLGAALIFAVSKLVGSREYPVPLPAEYEALTDVTDSTTAPALSPDGRMLAFIRGGEPFLSSGQIWLQVLPHGEPVQLTSEHAAVFAPTFTP